MAFYNARQYTDFKGVSLKAANGCLRFEKASTAPTTTSGEQLLYVNSSGYLVYDDGSSATTLGSAGAVANYSLNDGYDDGRTITVDAGPVILAGTNADTATLNLTANAASSGPVLLIANSGSGNDVTGTSSTWVVSAAGAATFASVIAESVTAAANLTIDATGAGTVTIAGTSSGAIALGSNVTVSASKTVTIAGAADAATFTITAGDFAMSNGKMAITNDDTDTALAVTANSVTSGSGVLVTANGVTSGAIIKTVTTNSGFTGTHFLADEDASTVFSVGAKGAVTIAGNASGTDALTLSAGDVNVSQGLLKVTNSTSAQTLMTLKDTNADANGPVLLIQKDSASPANNDVVGILAFDADDDATTQTRIARVRVLQTDVGAASDDGRMLFELAVAGALNTEVARLDASGLTTTLGVISTVADTINKTGLTVNQNDTSNNPIGIQVVNAGTGVDLELKGTQAGAQGPQLALYQLSASPADNDVVASIRFEGDDDGATRTVYGRINCVALDVTDTTEDGALNFLVNVGGTVTQALAINSSINGLIVGSGAAAGVVTSSGAYDLTLSTNSGTNSGTITITDAANGNIIVTPNGVGRTSLFAPSYGQVTSKADTAPTLTVAESGLILCANTASRAYTLPAAANNAGLWYTFKKTSADAQPIVITPAAGTIDGAATNNAIDAQYDTQTIVCDGTNWHIVHKSLA